MNIQNKLFLVVFSFSFFLVTSIIVLVQWSIDKGMVEYVHTKETNALNPLVLQLESMYVTDNSWDKIQGKHQKFGRLLSLYLEDTQFGFTGGPPHVDRPPRMNRREESPEFNGLNQNKKPPSDGRRRRDGPPSMRHVSYALIDENKKYIVGDYPENKEYTFSPVHYQEKVVGYLVVSKREELTEGYEFEFISQQYNTLLWGALGLMFLVVIITIPLAMHLVAPIKQLAKGVHSLTQGQYKQKVTLKRKDEIGMLSRDFNELANTLAANESARKRWLANISHELRTPVAILRGELEAMIDGVRELSIENVDSAHQEVNHLASLIDDLHMLTSADIGGMSYRKEELNLSDFLLVEFEKYVIYLAESTLSFSVGVVEKNINVMADPTRLCQLMDNLINNCVKYAKQGSTVQWSIIESAGFVDIIIEDDGEGVDDIHLEHLFEHLYRVEGSRNRETGGTGLGLSICAQIVKAHQGEIKASNSSLGGLAITITLPTI